MLGVEIDFADELVDRIQEFDIRNNIRKVFVEINGRLDYKIKGVYVDGKGDLCLCIEEMELDR